MPHLARLYTVETTRPPASPTPLRALPPTLSRSKLVAGRRAFSQDEKPRKSLWLFSCNLPCKRCSEILPRPQTQREGEERELSGRRFRAIDFSSLLLFYSKFFPFALALSRSLAFLLLFLLFYSRFFVIGPRVSLVFLFFLGGFIIILLFSGL